jgi:hypothetical protein
MHTDFRLIAGLRKPRAAGRALRALARAITAMTLPVINAMTLPAIWRARYDLAWAKVLLWIAGDGVVGEPKPAVHAYLALLYHELANEHQRRGRLRRAARLRAIARDHEISGPDLPPAAAMGLSRQPYSRTPARGAPMGPRPAKRPWENGPRPRPPVGVH